MGDGADYDVIVVGAGISGISAAWHLQARCPGVKFLVLERRHEVGGTWSLFQFPGIRSDSDMYSFAFHFAPYTGSNAIADGHEIQAYLKDVCAKENLERFMRFSDGVKEADFDTGEGRWTLTMESGQVYRTRFLWSTTGYYDHSAGFTPDLPGMGSFKNELVHAQDWIAGKHEYAGKKVVIIGSGATATTMIPVVAEKAKEVIMLQRSPSYVFPMPRRVPLMDAARSIADRLAGWVPKQFSFLVFLTQLPLLACGFMLRWFFVTLYVLVYGYSKLCPSLAKATILNFNRWLFPGLKKRAKDFTPSYYPWDQRICVCPDGDFLFAVAGAKPSARVVTDHISTFTTTGIELTSGAKLEEVDMVVLATGLKMQFLGGISMTVDSKPMDFPNSQIYKSCMISGVPNFAFTVGYINNSWTLRTRLTSEHVCKVLNYMARNAYALATPTLGEHDTCSGRPMMDLSASYVRRHIHELPQQGDKEPWKVGHNYYKDWYDLSFRWRVNDGSLVFRHRQ